MNRLIWLLRQFTKNRKSGAALEFAIMGSTMVIMLLGTIEITNAVRVQTKLNIAAGQLAEMVANQTAVSIDAAGNLTDMCTGAAFNLIPFNTANMYVSIGSTTVIQNGANTAPATDWSEGFNTSGSLICQKSASTDIGGAALQTIADTPVSLFTANGVSYASGGTAVAGYSAISVSMSYDYANVIPLILGAKITLTAQAAARPRSNSTISCTTTAASTTACSTSG